MDARCHFVIILLQIVSLVLCCSEFKSCDSCLNSNSPYLCEWNAKSSSCFVKIRNLGGNEVISDVRKCPKLRLNYDEELSKRLALYSAIAYAPKSQDFIKRMFGNLHYEGFLQVTVPCELKIGLCSAYTLVSHTDKAVLIVFRGTNNTRQLIFEFLNIIATPKVNFRGGGKVQKYFLHTFETLWAKLGSHAIALISKYANYNVYVTGHSLGAALASLCAATIVYDRNETSSRLHLFTFGQPRVGNSEYANVVDRLINSKWRVVHYNDIVPHLPPCFPILPNKKCNPKSRGPYHHGFEVYYNNIDMKKGYKTCTGSPKDEDGTCSDAAKVLGTCTFHMGDCIYHHRHYFGINISGWWENKTITP